MTDKPERLHAILLFPLIDETIDECDATFVKSLSFDDAFTRSVPTDLPKVRVLSLKRVLQRIIKNGFIHSLRYQIHIFPTFKHVLVLKCSLNFVCIAFMLRIEWNDIFFWCRIRLRAVRTDLRTHHHWHNENLKRFALRSMLTQCWGKRALVFVVWMMRRAKGAYFVHQFR